MKPLLIAVIVLQSFWLSAQNVAFELSEMNLAYIGLENPLNVAISGVDQEDVIVKTSEGCSYANGKLKVTRKARLCKVHAGYLDQGDTVWVDSTIFRVRRLPMPRAQLGAIPNDGQPKGKAAIMTQQKLLISMGAGFAYNFSYSVTAYNLIVVYKDAPPEMHSASSSRLTGAMRTSIQKIKPGDKLIFEGIKVVQDNFGTRHNLSPIIIEVAGSSLINQSHFDQYAIFYNGHQIDTLTIGTFGINKRLREFKTGEVHFFTSDEFGYHRIEKKYKKGIEISNERFDHYGRKVSSLIRIDSNTWNYRNYYPNGNIKIETLHKEGIVLRASDSLFHCKFSGHLAYYEESCEFFEQFRELGLLHFKHSINPSNFFKLYHENGVLAQEGELAIIEGEDLPDGIICGTGMTYYTYTDHTVCDGKWKFYAQDGSLIEVKKYRLGTEL